MANKDKYGDVFKFFQRSFDREITDIGKVLGKGAFGEVRDIKFKNKNMAGKLIENESEQKSEEEQLALELRGQNIIRINKIYSKHYKDKYYDLVIMEKAILRDLGKLNEFFHRHNLLKLIYDDVFDEKSGDNLLRFYSRQIINALEVLDRNNYIHFDIKPENLLITINLIIKLSDFSLLRKIGDEKIKLPGGTPGYITPEYFIEKYVSSDLAKKQDYFALGSSLFILKYGVALLKYRKNDDGKLNSDRIIDLIIRNISYIKSRQVTDKDFMDFLISLIQHNPENRPSFEQIYRNKWLNKNCDELDKVVMAFESDEEKLIMELQKNDFLSEKEKKLKENKNNLFKFRFKKKMN